ETPSNSMPVSHLNQNGVSATHSNQEKGFSNRGLSARVIRSRQSNEVARIRPRTTSAPRPELYGAAHAAWLWRRPPQARATADPSPRGRGQRAVWHRLLPCERPALAET